MSRLVKRMDNLREMLQRATYRHKRNHVRDLTPFVHGMTADEVADLLADQPGNRDAGKDREYLKDRWVTSERFYPMTVPVHAVHPVRVPSGKSKSQTVGPIVIEDNFRHTEQVNGGEGDKGDGFIPDALIIDGQHRHNDAKNAGEQYMQAVVGEKAIPKVLAETFRLIEQERTKYSRSGAKQIYDKLSAGGFRESEHPRNSDGEFTDGGKNSPRKKRTIRQAHRLLRRHGFHILGGAGFDFKTKTTSYHVRGPDGKTSTMTSHEINDLIDRHARSGNVEKLARILGAEYSPTALETKVQLADPADPRSSLLGFVNSATPECRAAGTVCEHCCHFRYNPGTCGLFVVLGLPATVPPDAYCKAFV